MPDWQAPTSTKTQKRTGRPSGSRRWRVRYPRRKHATRYLKAWFAPWHLTSKPTEGQAPTRMRAPCRSNSRPRALVSVGAGGYFFVVATKKMTWCNDVRIIITTNGHRTPLVFGACVRRCGGIRRREYGTGLLPFLSACGVHGGVAHGCGVCGFFLFTILFFEK